MKLKMNAGQLRKGQGGRVKGKVEKQEIYIILDNVLDTYNIGAIFRLADAVAAKKIFLCGGTETPPNHKIRKSSINTTEIVEWEYCESAVQAIKKIRKFSTSVEQYSSSESKTSREVDSIKVVAIEQDSKSIPYDKYDYPLPLALVVGHETEGVSKEVLDLCDAIVELPMFGINISLNVMTSLAIVLYQVIEANTPLVKNLPLVTFRKRSPRSGS